MSTLRAIREAIQAAVVGINGVSPYTLNLSATDALKVGRFNGPWMGPPCAALFLESESAEVGPTMTSRTRTARFLLAVWVAMSADSATAEGREDAAEDAYENVRRRFRDSADRRLAGICHDTIIALEDVMGPDETQSVGQAAALVVISISAIYRESA